VEQPLVSDRQIVVTHPWRPPGVLALLAVYFSLFGVIIGAQGVLWAELVSALRLSKSTFGAVQLVSPLLSVLLLLAGGQLASWAGKKRLALLSMLVLAGSNLMLASADGLLGLAGALLLAGAGNALLEMAMNGATLDWEQATGRSVMNTPSIVGETWNGERTFISKRGIMARDEDSMSAASAEHQRSVPQGRGERRQLFPND